ncbi:hypothetical protein AB833_00345 [Chromatiales bacterium (ex Bugula neritina AB1)]|nr:hypothetical protein AB833_00345 [Chromatiales bacterium (ex Bugula neritina AB1)]
MVKEAVAVTVAFGNECNGYVDIIQQALDTALGSSGNLLPDKPVVSALEELRSSVDRLRVAPLAQLLEPLSVILTSAESAGRTLSQSDTLLVQEAIVAITLGIDSLVNKKPLPELITEVTNRITAVAVDGKHRLRGDAESSGLIDVFVEEAEELLHRLFELIQRWRGAPHGGSKLQSDISRLLHTLKGSADTVGLGDLAELAHYLESVLVGLKHRDTAPDTDTFELILETIEVLSDDIDSIRNNERLTEHQELIDKLSMAAESCQAGGLPESRTPLMSPPAETGGASKEETASLANTEALETPETVIPEGERAPVFGSARYFIALETSQRILRQNHSESCSFHEELKLQLAELTNVLQNALHLRKRVIDSALPAGIKNVDESILDIGKVKNRLEELSLRADGIIGRQSIAIDGLGALLSTADDITVESMRLRLESIVSQAARQTGKLVSLEVFGCDLAIERRYYSDLLSSLEQLLSNAVVHGIEEREVRREGGKALEGVIKVVFRHADHKLLVEIQDDGAGIDLQALRKTVSQRSRIDTARLSDQELLKYLIRQGVSTAETASRASGRGVGLDVVRDCVYRHYGDIELVTSMGAGSKFSLSLPMSTVSHDVMIVEDARQYYAISCSKIIAIEGADDNAVSLQALLGGANHTGGKEAPVVKCRIGTREYSVCVDAVLGRKVLGFAPAEQVFFGMPQYRGAAMYDGSKIVFLLDLNYLLKNDRSGRVSAASRSSVPTVLVVDDSVTIRASFGRALVGLDYKIELARNGVEALKVLENKTPDAIVLDLEMPLMDGFEFAERISVDPSRSDIPLIIVTNRPRDSIEDWLNNVGAALYLEKPCAENVLSEAVAGLLALQMQ